MCNANIFFILPKVWNCFAFGMCHGCQEKKKRKKRMSQGLCLLENERRCILMKMAQLLLWSCRRDLPFPSLPYNRLEQNRICSQAKSHSTGSTEPNRLHYVEQGIIYRAQTCSSGTRWQTHWHWHTWECSLSFSTSQLNLKSPCLLLSCSFLQEWGRGGVGGWLFLHKVNDRTVGDTGSFHSNHV